MSVGIENIVLIPGENTLEGYGLFGDHGVMETTGSGL
jgi:hypothetical protein